MHTTLQPTLADIAQHVSTSRTRAARLLWPALHGVSVVFVVEFVLGSTQRLTQAGCERPLTDMWRPLARKRQRVVVFNCEHNTRNWVAVVALAHNKFVHALVVFVGLAEQQRETLFDRFNQCIWVEAERSGVQIAEHLLGFAVELGAVQVALKAQSAYFKESFCHGARRNTSHAARIDLVQHRCPYWSNCRVTGRARLGVHLGVHLRSGADDTLCERVDAATSRNRAAAACLTDAELALRALCICFAQLRYCEPLNRAAAVRFALDHGIAKTAGAACAFGADAAHLAGFAVAAVVAGLRDCLCRAASCKRLAGLCALLGGAAYLGRRGTRCVPATDGVRRRTASIHGTCVGARIWSRGRCVFRGVCGNCAVSAASRVNAAIRRRCNNYVATRRDSDQTS
jgi:hypothetical protein